MSAAEEKYVSKTWRTTIVDEHGEKWQITESYTIDNPVLVADIMDELALQSDINESTLARREQLSLDLVRSVHRHVLPPTGLGLRKASFVHKLNAIMHSIYNEVHDEQRFRTFLDSIHSVTTDLGTEKELAEVLGLAPD